MFFYSMVRNKEFTYKCIFLKTKTKNKKIKIKIKIKIKTIFHIWVSKYIIFPKNENKLKVLKDLVN